MKRFMAMVLVLCSWPVAHAASNVQGDLDAILRLQPDLEAGERLYTVACAVCHGVAGEGQPRGLAPRLAGQRSAVIAGELVKFRRGQRTDARMQAQASGHALPGLQEVADVTAFAAQLAGRASTTTSSSLPDAAPLLFANLCSTCHGPRAEGSEQPAVPRLAGQNQNYLARQLRDMVDGRRPAAARNHLQPLGSLDAEQLASLADYLSRLR